MGQQQDPQTDQQFAFVPGMTFQTGQTPDGRCVIQVISCMVVEPAFMRQIARQFVESADKAEGTIMVPQKPPLIRLH